MGFVTYFFGGKKIVISCRISSCWFCGEDTLVR
ncbi:hypothetical protein AKJ16_DCAP13792 [Drosera capensis]